MRKRRWATPLLATVVLLALVPLPNQAAAEPPDPTGPKDRTVTLITGDKVVLKHGDRDQFSVIRADGRDRIGFESRRTADGWTVIPSDVRGAVETGKLDRRLFDLDRLLRDGYDDATRADIPLIVTGASVQSRQATKTLKTGTALSVPKQNAAAVFQQLSLQQLGRQSDRAKAPTMKIWLDGKLRPSLDHSVPQIGTPAAWQAGYTGKGVTVAVLDSGIDATHPELTGQVVASRNFTTEPAADVVGHGTHVASTIAGKGTDGYQGVAPDAKLLDGKVCDDFGGCAESDVLAGLEWAVAQKAKVVNLSLGGAGQEAGPLDQAVDRWTRETGTLFVVAAGNNGREVESPGTAASALTVGAVDRDEKLADFSAPGPVSGGAIKPDVTAPGVGIVAAKSSASHPEEPIGDRYARMSGTSMATPHVTGAAALLAQQHTGWKAAELKAALTSTAKANPALTPYQQGSGRVDVARAVQQTVVATTSSISFGTAQWPHADDKPVTKEVGFKNFGAAAVTLDLRAELKLGSATGVVKLSADRLTVPAGGQASVQVTSETTHSGPDGLYTGNLTATAGSQQVVVPLVADKEVESYDVKATVLGADGKPVPPDRAFVGLLNLDTLESSDPGRVAKGKYQLDVTAFGPAGEHYRIVQPQLEIRRDTTLVVDLRKAKPVKISVPRPDARTFVVFFGYQVQNKAGDRVLTFNLQPEGDKLFLGRMGGPVSPTQFQGFVSSYVGRVGADGTLSGSPYVYGLIDTQPGHFFNGLQRRVHTDRQLAHVVAQYNGPAGTESDWALVGRRPGVDTFPIAASIKLPSTVHQYLEPRADWQQILGEVQNEPRRYPLGTTTYETLTTPPQPPR